MEDDPGFRKHTGRLKRLLRKVEALLDETDTALDALTSDTPTTARLGQLGRLRSKLEESLQEYLDQNTSLLDYTRGQFRKIEEANTRADMAKQRSGPVRDEARIQELSQELTTKLRLERIDSAIKELLDLLSDADFFAANASTGRRRRLRTLQNAIDKALQR